MDRQDSPGDDGELQARLDAYAASHLDGDPAATARARAALMVEARRVLGTPPPVDDGVSRGRFGRIFRRPALAAATALLGLALVAGGTVVAATPGGPLYGARLWVETLTLPSEASARAAAELDRLQARLDDAAAAAANGNGNAVTAALDAYRQTLADAFATADSDPTRVQHLVAELGRHQAVLEALVGRVPATASAAIQQAVQRTEDRIDAIIQSPGQPNGTPNPGNPSPGNPNGTPNPGNPNPGHTPNPGNPNPGNPNGTPNPGNPNPGNPNGTPNPGNPNPGHTPNPGNPNPGHTPNPGNPNPDKTPPGHGG